MATSKEFKEFVLEQLSGQPISTRIMMGEYLVYYQGKLIGGLFDGRFLVKKAETNKSFGMEEAIPYPNGKPMYTADVDNRDKLIDVIEKTFQGL